MFHSARWKAYLKNLKSAGEDNAERDANSPIYHIYHSQMLWFTRDEANNHRKVAREHLEKCDELLGDCTTMVDTLQETLAKTPKPSEVLDWYSLW